MKTIKIAFLTPYPRGKAPSQRFRFEQYFPALIKHNIHYTVYSFLSINAWDVLYAKGKYVSKFTGIFIGFIKRFLFLFIAFRYDYIFIHREASPIGPPIFEWILAKLLKRKIIFDFDDAIWMPDRPRAINRIKCYSKIPKIISWCYKVSAGNEYLYDYAKKHNESVIINPTTIDLEYQKHQKHQIIPSKKVTLGWTGSHSTMMYLEQIEPVLIALLNRFDIELIIICNQKPELKVPYTFIKWQESTEVEDLLKIDIGIMPLEDTEWAKGKCGFKALQYMSLGIPAVVSPVGVNTKMIEEGKNGFCCYTNQEWETKLSHLIASVEMRKEMGENAYEFIKRQYSTTANTSNFLSLFN